MRRIEIKWPSQKIQKFLLFNQLPPQSRFNRNHKKKDIPPLEKHLQNHLAKMGLQDGSFKNTVIKYLFLGMKIEKTKIKEMRPLNTAR